VRYITDWTRHGHQRGFLEGKLEMARAMLGAGVEPELVVQATSLRIEDITRNSQPLRWDARGIYTMENYEMVREALLLRHQLFGLYDGQTCQLCPHLLGWKNTERGKVGYGLFYVFKGSAASAPSAPDGLEDGFRCMEVDKLEGLHSLPGPWHSGEMPANHEVDEVDLSFWDTPTLFSLQAAEDSPREQKERAPRDRSALSRQSHQRGFDEGKAVGLEEGRNEGKIEAARALYLAGVNQEVLSKALNLKAEDFLAAESVSN
jgi:hypothetical protein